MPENLIHKPLDYHELLAYRKADLVYVLNYWFIKNCDLASKRTYEQMEQAARSGKQNIAEGINNYATSKSSGIHLINVAIGSLKELQSDYEDFLKIHRFEKWDFRGEKFKAAQKLGREKYENPQYFISLFEKRTPDVIANVMSVLIGQAIYLEETLLSALEQDLRKNGGFRENIYKLRVKKRERIPS